MGKKKDSKGKVFSFANYDLKHLSNLLKQKKAIDKIYDTIAMEAALIGVASKFDDAEKEFHLSDFPATQKRIDNLVAMTASMLLQTVKKGNEQAWLLSNAKNSAMIDAMVAKTGIPKETVEKWKAPNLKALEAFQQRDLGDGDIKLSDRVWQMSQQTKQELELALDIGLGEGKSAAELSRDVRRYLKEPNKLFRRVRDKHGNLRLSKAAETYHPGQGVYRSSYKNALRLTATENNMAYRTADHDKWQGLDMVIGQKIQLSNNHTLNGKPFHDICDEMQGDYPKTFKFVGWHPFCRCFVTPILASWEEQLKVMKMRKEGKDVSDYHYDGEITDMPQGYKDWMEKNAERLLNAKKLPYWVVKDEMQTFQQNVGNMSTIVDDIKNNNNILHIPVNKHKVQPTTEDIIKNVGGGDLTGGSCSSLAFAYAGNKGGLDMLDFRGGKSTDYFSSSYNIDNIVLNAGGQVVKTKKELHDAVQLLNTIDENKEYYFGAGRHAAIVKKEQGKYYYLELQSPVDNGYKPLSTEKLKSRFAVTKSSKYTRSLELVEIGKLSQSKGYAELMGYINTLETAQKKGHKGKIK